MGLKINDSETSSLVSRPLAICCPECGRIVVFNEKGCNYPCERCGVLWRWYQRGASDGPIEIRHE